MDILRSSLMAITCCAALGCNESSGGSARPATLESGTPLHWTFDRIVLQLAPEHAGVPIPASVRASLTRAARIWNDALDGCGAPKVVIADAQLPRAAVREDRVNEVVFHERAWCAPSSADPEDCYDATRHASTRLRPRRDLHGVIEEAEIEVNGVAFRWSARGEEPGTLSLEAVFAHELGHVLGLDHLQDPASNAVMHPNAAESLVGRDLEPLRAEVDTVCRSHGH